MKVNIVYIDDDMDDPLSEYLDRYLPSDIADSDVDINYEEVEYDQAEGLHSLLNDPKVQHANIAIIDSKLFTTESADRGMLTGEEFRVVLRKAFPYIETFIITQNDDRKRSDLGVLSKYDRNTSKYASPKDYYTAELAPIIENAIKELRFFETYGNNASLESVDVVYRDKILNSLHGISDYDILAKDDIDEAISHFETIKKLIANGM